MIDVGHSNGGTACTRLKAMLERAREGVAPPTMVIRVVTPGKF